MVILLDFIREHNIRLIIKYMQTGSDIFILYYYIYTLNCTIYTNYKM